jgi:hypothetical protein
MGKEAYKMKKSLAIGIALAVVLSGSSFFSPAPAILGLNTAYASVSQMTVSESTMYTKMSNRTRFAVYVYSGGSYREYASSASNPRSAAQEILNTVRSGKFRTSNSSLYQAFLQNRGFRPEGSFTKYGTTVYCFAG